MNNLQKQETDLVLGVGSRLQLILLHDNREEESMQFLKEFERGP
jgi:hypothetical protein